MGYTGKRGNDDTETERSFVSIPLGGGTVQVSKGRAGKKRGGGMGQKSTKT